MDNGIKTIIGTGTTPAYLALAMLFKKKPKRSERLVVLDYTGRLSLTAQMSPETPQPPEGTCWYDLADRRSPVALFQLAHCGALRQVLLSCLSRLRGITGHPLADQTLKWAAEAGYILSQKGTVGLGALLRSLSSAEVRAWFLATQCDPEQLRELLNMLSWCLDFPAIHALSEGNNRFEGLLAKPSSQRTLWFEMLSEHFERDEHRIMTVLVETAVEIEMRRIMEATPPSPQTPSLTIIHAFPPERQGEAPPAWVAESASFVRHVYISQLRPGAPLSVYAMGWVQKSQTVFMPGPMGKLSANVHGEWLTGNELSTLAKLEHGSLYVRDNAKGNGIVARTAGGTPRFSEVHARRTASKKQRNESPFRQFRLAAQGLWPADPRSLGLYQRLCDVNLLLEGWIKVKGGSKESHGVDGVTIRQFKEKAQEELTRLSSELQAKKYRCKPLRQAKIAKPDGGFREIGVSCVRDRVVQSACLSLIEPLWESDFSRFSFAFRPRRNAHQAIALVSSLIASGRTWAVTADIKKCFDSIDQEVLFQFLAQKIGDHDLLALIRQWLTADVIEFREVLPLAGGVPQGCAISPFLANIYLDPLDKYFEQCGVNFVRYADDIMILISSEEEALKSLDMLQDFLAASLHLALKPAKTNHVAVAAGFDFLGFTFQGGRIGIRSSKMAAVREALFHQVRALGAAPDQAALMTAWQKLNALIRGARNYYALPDELAIAEQLWQLDAYVEETAGLYLPAHLRNDAAWLLRERFTAEGDFIPTADGAPGVSQRLGTGYPAEPGPVLPPQQWLVKDEAPEEQRPASVSAAQPEADEGVPVVWSEGRVYILQHGCYVRSEEQSLVIRKKKVEIWRRDLSDVVLVFLQGQGISIAAETQLLLARLDIPLVVASPLGDFCAVLSPMTSERAHIRSQQAMRSDEPDMVLTGLEILAAKVTNQAALLKYFAKYRKKINPAQAAEMLETAGNIDRQAGFIRSLDPTKAEVSKVAMGYEGRAAAIYWKRIASLVPAELQFGGRIARGAKDAVNQCLNYAYAILYGEVWQAVVKAGLDPYFGIMHGSKRDQGSLVFDLIEEFRAPFVDRLVLSLLGRKFQPALGAQGLLTTRSKRVLVAGFLKRWENRLQWRGRSISPSAILERQARTFAELVLRQGGLPTVPDEMVTGHGSKPSSRS